jgi:hypothetical protein
MEPEWNDECVEGHIRLKKAGRFVLAMREAFQRDVGLHPNVPVEDIDLDPAAADGPTALGQALKL